MIQLLQHQPPNAIAKEGERYGREVKAQGGDRKSEEAKSRGHVSGKDDPLISTADTIAKKGSGMGGR
jgi:hypothetical protein